MTKQRANQIYDLLVEKASAPEAGREDFVSFHTNNEMLKSLGSSEWRLNAKKLDWGGKFRINRDKYYVSVYKEDETPEMNELVLELNEALKNIELQV